MSANQDTRNTTLYRHWILAARSAWIAVATLTLGLAAAGFAVGLDRPDLIRQPSARAIFAHGGVPDQVTNVAFILLIAVFAVTGLLIFWRRSDDWAAMLFALMLITGGIVPIRMEWALERAGPWREPPIRFVWLLAMFLFLIVLFVFPDGRFVPHWTRLLGAAAIPAAVLLVDFPVLVELPEVSQGGAKVRLGLALLVWSVFFGTGLYAQAYRYRPPGAPAGKSGQDHAQGRCRATRDDLRPRLRAICPARFGADREDG